MGDQKWLEWEPMFSPLSGWFVTRDGAVHGYEVDCDEKRAPRIFESGIAAQSRADELNKESK